MVLSEVPGVAGSDYINANYCDVMSGFYVGGGGGGGGGLKADSTLPFPNSF